MPLWSDLNGFPEAGFPTLANEYEQICLGTLYNNPLKINNLILDVVGNNRLAGTLTGVTSLTMAGALAGATTIGASSTVTLSSATAPLTMSGATALMTMTGANAVFTMPGLNSSIGTVLQRINKGYFNNLILTNRPIVGEDYAALVGDLALLVPYNNAQYDVNLGTKKLITAEINFEVDAITRIFKDGSNNLSFTDAVTGTKTLAELAAASSYVYNNATPMPEDVGGYESTTTFTNQSLDDMFDGLLYPYQYPAFNTFTIQSQTTPLEVGASIAANRVFTWTTNLVGDANINAGSIVIRDVTGNADIATGLNYDDTPYTSTYAAITKTTATTNQFSITGTNSKSETFNKTYTVTWQWKRYYGASTSATLDETGIEALTGELASGFAKATPGYAFSALTNGYKYLCYPAVLGTATSFKDAATGLNVPMESVYTVSVTTNTATPVTTNYNVHRSTNILNDAINIIVA